MKALFLLFVLALQAQETARPGINAGVTSQPAVAPKQSCDATDWQKRAEWLEQNIVALNAQLNALNAFYNAKDAIAALAPKEPPRPKGDTK